MNYRALFLPPLLSLALYSCVAPTPKTHFYTLTASELSPLEYPISQSIGIGPINIPDMLMRPQIVVRTGKNQLDLRETEHWGGRLDQSINQVLVENLQRLIPSAKLIAYPWPFRARPSFQLRINLLQFDGNPDTSSTLRATWSLLDSKSKAELNRGSSSVTTPNASQDFPGMVRNMSLLLARLAEVIADDLVHADLQSRGNRT